MGDHNIFAETSRRLIILRDTRRVLFSLPVLGALALCGPVNAAPVQAPCDGDRPASGTDRSCTTSDEADGNEVVITFTGADGEDHDAGHDGGTFTLTNNADLSAVDYQGDLVGLVLNGGSGSNGHGSKDNAAGGPGGTVNVINNGDLIYTGTAGGSTPIGIRAQGNGGQGASGAGQQDGARGGDGAEISKLTNTAKITITPQGNFGAADAIYASSQGGNGGLQNYNCCQDEIGGAGGNARTIHVDNSGALTVKGNATAALRGIYTRQEGGAAGKEAAAGGNIAGALSITNTGDITVAGGNNELSQGAVGILSIQAGGAGSQSDDNDNTGGAGGYVNSVNITSSGNINVTADVAKPTNLSTQGGGIVVGTRGGTGGNSPAPTTGSGHAAGVGGGRADDAKLYITQSDGSITTSGDYLPGISAHTIGGAGGNGRSQADAADGGRGMSIEVKTEYAAAIKTDGFKSIGISAVSEGGAGGYQDPDGDGIFNFYEQTAGSGNSGGSVTVATGVAENGGIISSGDSGSITTTGTLAHGIRAQSFGGVGGGTGSSFTLADAQGQDAGGGGNASGVAVTSGSTITTHGDFALGILAQAVAGGGGDVDPSLGVIEVAGDAAKGGSATQLVQTQLYGDIHTMGKGSIGVLNQSIGGGGGNGGSAAGVYAVGGHAGSGGDSGESTVKLHGANVTTQGDFAFGVVAQSVGGGGGVGGSEFNASVKIPAVGIGGTGGTGGHGGTVTVASDSSSGSISTMGDNAHALVAQSIGGGGGTGGDSTGMGVGSIADFQMAGGAGGGGNGGQVNVSLDTKAIVATGSNANGILAQSIGGGGGVGGSASAFDANLGFSLSASVGGSGDSGGYGSTASVKLVNSSIQTGSIDPDTGSADPDITDSHGIVVQSIGGGGGAAGSSAARAMTVAIPFDPAAPVSIGVAVGASIGGDGGKGGNGGNVSASLTGSQITTLNNGSMGIIAQSIGGGGGLGGSSSSMAGVLAVGDSVTGSVSSALGGDGGGASDGGTASVSLDGTSAITTHGNYANAIMAQSIGGGGGSGGPGDAQTGRAGGTFAISVDMAMGGKGEAGGSPTAVAINLDEGSVIHTYGSGARGVLAQAIGGGGGTSQGGHVGLGLSGSVAGVEGPAGEEGEDIGVAVNGSVTLGGSGTSGGNAYNGASPSHVVAVTAKGVVKTEGRDADGYLLQAIGGGGGLGGSVGSDSEDAAPSLIGGDGLDFTLDVGGGGNGGNGGHGGSIKIDYLGQTTTQGDWADGVVLQSIGGGGGAGGTATTPDVTLAMSLGGKGGSGGDGGGIAVNLNGSQANTSGGNSIVTHGYAAYGLLAQSIGGGGGQASDGSDQATGTIFVGNPTASAGQGPAGNGGTVSVSDFMYWFETAGDDAPALVAQSIGGGGGVGGAGSRTAVASSGSHSIGLRLGSMYSTDANNGGNVEVAHGGQVSTSGDRSYGIVAQSIGGGGGIGFAGPAAGITSTDLGTDGGGGNGGAVSVTYNQDHDIYSLVTAGDGAHAIVAQSIGGGGGIGGDPSAHVPNLLANLSSTRVGYGDGGFVTVNVDAPITTTGKRAYGVLAQSIGGGGGIGGDQNGAFMGASSNLSGDSNSDGVTVKNTKPISATGLGSTGIFAQSVARDSLGPVQVTVDAPVIGGVAECANNASCASNDTVVVDGTGVTIVGGINSDYASAGMANQLTVMGNGRISATPGASGEKVAVLYQGDTPQALTVSGLDIAVQDGGTIDGDIVGYYSDGTSLTPTGNASSKAATMAVASSPAGGKTAAVHVINEEGGTLSGANRYLADITNQGSLIVNPPSARTLFVAGDLTQTDSGTLFATNDTTDGSLERVHVGGHADLAGTLRLNPINVVKGAKTTVLRADGGVSGLFDRVDSELFSYQLSESGGRVGVTPVASDFVQDRFHLDGNQRELGHYLDRLFDGGGVNYGPFFAGQEMAARADDGFTSLRNQFSQLTPGVSLASAAATFELSKQQLDGLFDCATGSVGALPEGGCLRMQVAGRSLNQSSNSNGVGYDGSLYGLTIGAAEVPLTPNLTAGFQVGAYHSSFDANDNRSNAKGDTVHAGFGLTRNWGAFALSAGVNGSYGNQDTKRRINVSGETRHAEADHDTSSLGGRIRAAYTASFGSSYVKPFIDLDVVHTWTEGYQEHGANELDLKVSHSDETAWIATPAVEVGTVLDVGNGLGVDLYARGGVSFSSLNYYNADARFAADSTGAGSFTFATAVPDVVGRVSVGMNVYNDKGVSVGLRFDGAYGSGFNSNAGSLNFSMAF